jgi:hypothetical protein
MADELNYYDILRVQKDSPTAQITAEYERRRPTFQPEFSKEDVPWAAELDKAYAVLSDRERRREYDKKLADETARRAPAQSGRPPEQSTAPAEPSWVAGTDTTPGGEPVPAAPNQPIRRIPPWPAPANHRPLQPAIVSREPKVPLLLLCSWDSLGGFIDPLKLTIGSLAGLVLLLLALFD